MNEADAKTKWCPMVRIVPLARPIEEMTIVDNRGNPGAEFAPDTRCIGSECMAWRSEGLGYTGREITVKTPDGGARIEKETGPMGYCGLAGPDCI